MKVGLKELPNLVSAYQFLDQATVLGHEPLEFLPLSNGVRVLLQLSGSRDVECQTFELSDSILKAYLGLDSGQVKSHVGIIEFSKLSDAFVLAVEAEAIGMMVHDIRFLKGANQGHHVILSHSQSPELKSFVQKKQGYTFSAENKKMMEFLGFSNIAVD